MIRARIIGLIREKAGLIRIKSPVHRREKKSLNRPNCGHDLMTDRAVLCRTRKNPCFSGPRYANEIIGYRREVS